MIDKYRIQPVHIRKHRFLCAETGISMALWALSNSIQAVGETISHWQAQAEMPSLGPYTGREIHLMN